MTRPTTHRRTKRQCTDAFLFGVCLFDLCFQENPWPHGRGDEPAAIGQTADDQPACIPCSERARFAKSEPQGDLTCTHSLSVEFVQSDSASYAAVFRDALYQDFAFAVKVAHSTREGLRTPRWSGAYQLKIGSGSHFPRCYCWLTWPCAAPTGHQSRRPGAAGEIGTTAACRSRTRPARLDAGVRARWLTQLCTLTMLLCARRFPLSARSFPALPAELRGAAGPDQGRRPDSGLHRRSRPAERRRSRGQRGPHGHVTAIARPITLIPSHSFRGVSGQPESARSIGFGPSARLRTISSLPLELGRFARFLFLCTR